MIFTLEALNAKRGDCLVLSWGTPDKLRHIVIDGGPEGVWKNSLLPRLKQLRDGHLLDKETPLPIEMVMVSHIDDDHINGVLDFFSAIDHAMPSPDYRVKTLWHNSFDEIIGNGPAEMKSKLAALGGEVAAGTVSATEFPGGDHSAAIVASVGQGRKLRAAAENLHILMNAGFVGLVMRKNKPVVAPISGGLKFHIVGPSQARLEALLADWEKDVAAHPATANVAAFVDKSVANLSSIVIVAELEGKTMLLTGDARGDDVLAGLASAGFLDDPKTGTCHFDILKMPHHGSNRNMETDFLKRVTADHYIFSADGEFDNPDAATLQMLGTARAGQSFHIHFTNEAMVNPKNGKDVGKLTKETLSAQGMLHQSIFRKNGDLGVRIDLLDELPF